MTSFTVDRVRARYRMPDTRDGGKARLDRILREALKESLDRCLSEAGFRDTDLIFVRRLFVPFGADLSSTDDAVAEAWARAVAEHLVLAVEKGDDRTFVRYRSPSEALLDLIHRVARGDRSRAWAWEGWGVWHAGEAAGPTEVARGVSRALLSEPTLIAPLMEEAARDPGSLDFLLREIPREAWEKLARTALAAAGGARSLLESPPDPRHAVRKEGDAGEGIPGEADFPLGLAGPDDRKRPPLPASLLASPLVRGAGGRVGDPGAARALSLLAVLAWDPASLSRREEARSVMARLSHILVTDRRSTGPAPGRGAPVRGRPAPGSEERRPTSEGSPGDPEERPFRDDRRPRLERLPREERSEPESPARATEGAGARRSRAGADPSPRAGARAEGGSPDQGSPSPAPRSAEDRTEHGGLLFLLHLVDGLGLPARAQDDPRFEGRSFRWVLHRIALDLVPMRPDDAAALAFCGLPPGSHPPSRDAEPPRNRETRAVEELSVEILQALQARLDASEEEAGALLRQVVRRSAGVVADPGWIEVRLLLREVDLPVRKAGLDLDPGHLPWLGAVVRFAYV